MRRIFSKGVGKFFLVGLGLIIAAYFAWNFYYFGEWIGQRFLASVPEGQFLSGYGTSLIMLIAVLVSFFYKEHLKEEIEAYEAEKGDGTFIRALNGLVWVIVGLEVFSVGFRWYILNFSVVGIILLGIGVLLIGLEYIVGKITHAVANAPSAVKAARVMDLAEASLWDEAPKYIPQMNAEQKRRLASGNTDPLDEVMDIMGERRTDRLSRRQEAQQKQQSRFNKAREAASEFIKPRANDASDFE